MMYLHPELKKQLTPAESDFHYFMGLQGEAFRALEGRCTQRLLLKGESYFIKQHFGIGWKEIFKNLFQGKFPILSAKNEWQALERLQKLSVLTPSLRAYGAQGFNPARRHSFLLMRELKSTVSLEDFCRDWKKKPPSLALKRALIQKIAEIARTLHTHGINHRDFYLCHFLLEQPLSLSDLKLYLIDLHRAGIHSHLRKRWIIKDLAGLYFSSKDLGLSQRDFYRFIKCYHQQNLPDIMKTQASFWQKVKTRGEKLYDEH